MSFLSIVIVLIVVVSLVLIIDELFLVGDLPHDVTRGVSGSGLNLDSLNAVNATLLERLFKTPECTRVDVDIGADLLVL